MSNTKFPSNYYPKDFQDFIERDLKVCNRETDGCLCPDCGSVSVEIELYDFSPNKDVFDDIAYCKDCKEVFVLVTGKEPQP